MGRFRGLRKRLSGIGLLWDACGCCTIGEKKRGFRLYLRHFRDADTTHQPPPPDLLPQGSRPMPSGGNAAEVMNKKVIRLSVSADIKGGLPFYSSPLPYRFWQKECCRLVRLLSFCFPEWVWSIKACNGMEGCRVARRATQRPVM